MNKIKRILYNAVGKIIAAMPNDTSQTSVSAGSGEKYDNPEMSALCRSAAAQGCVLLKNNGGILPLKKDEKISVFSRLQNDWFYTGYGSGGDVNAPYCVSLIDGLKNAGARLDGELAGKYRRFSEKNPPDKGFWAHWPSNQEEMRLTESEIRAAAERSGTAIVIIGRASGEDMENRLERGSWLLTKQEKRLLDGVTGAFGRVILILNCSNITDMSEIAQYGDKIGAVLLAWQGGMESGNAVADVLYGICPPCGKLTDTVAENYAAYPSSADFGKRAYNNYTEDIYVGYRYFETFAPEKVIYPFGFGLGYTEFNIENIRFKKLKSKVKITFSVKNTGSFKGRETPQIYVKAPCGRLGKPDRELVYFTKTRMLESGESEDFTAEIPIESLASYDDKESYSYILEAGAYAFYLGSDVRSASKCGEFTLDEEVTVLRLTQCAAAQTDFERLTNKDGSPVFEKAPVRKTGLKERIIASLPGAPGVSYIKKCTLKDVKDGRATLDEFIMALTPDELEALSRGDYTMNSPLGASGNAGVYCGVTQSLRDKGVPALTFTDGPSGIRLNKTASLLPIGTCLACTFDTQLVEKLYSLVGAEMKKLGSQVIAGPGMNIHRNPLCGRNFEYYSEDPLLTGKIGAAAVRGIQSNGVGACPKHFACNNQETNRTRNDSRLSERALREIYLKGFEICVKESAPLNIMTSYNKINSVWAHYHYELVRCILRGEWGYEGCVITDWWMRPSYSPEFPIIRDQAYRVRAGVNILMPGGERTGKRESDGTLLETLGKSGGITLTEIRENAKYILNFALNFVD